MEKLAKIDQSVQGQILDVPFRYGFVIYEVKDDTTQNSVWVSIVTTPETRGKFARPAPHVLDTDNLRDGLNQVIAEVRCGLAPTLGGRIIMIRSTGTMAFVGFGSAVVASSTNDADLPKGNLAAQEIASSRAKHALRGLIIGDKNSWEGSFVDSLRYQVEEFAALDRDDPLARTDPGSLRELEEARQAFVARMETNDTYINARKGVLPPGINTKTWFDTDNAWAYAMSVYVPGASHAAAGAAREMREPTSRATRKPAAESQSPKDN